MSFKKSKTSGRSLKMVGYVCKLDFLRLMHELDLKGEFKKARSIFNRVLGRHSHKTSDRPVPSVPSTIPATAMPESPLQPESRTVSKDKMSLAVASLLVYTVGVKCRGINKKEHYAPEHVFSLSEKVANEVIKQGMMDLIKHNRTHMVRIYPKGLRVNSSNYLPHLYWAAGAQLVAINWQTFGMVS
jgi:phosphatidylinositol phospholipase C delta